MLSGEAESPPSGEPLEKEPHQGRDTLAISGPSEGKGASQDYNSQDKQTSQSGSPVLKPQS